MRRAMALIGATLMSGCATSKAPPPVAFQTLDCPVCEAKPAPVIPTACKHGPVSEPPDPPLPPRPAPNAPPIAVETYKRAVLEARFQTQGARLGDANDLLRDCRQGLEEQGL